MGSVGCIRQTVTVRGNEVTMLRGGTGRPLVFLHGVLGEGIWLSFAQHLAEKSDLIMPLHPGFGTSTRHGVDDVEDLVYHYLEFFEELGIGPVDLVGVSFGGWLAAEIACRNPESVGSLVLANSLGLWNEEFPLGELFDPNGWQLLEKLFYRPSTFVQKQFGEASMVQVLRETPPELPLLRNLSTAARYGWNPYFHNPKLARRLHRIRCKTLIVWGEQDRFADPSYSRMFQRLIPGSTLELIPDAGHMVHIEQPEAFCRAVDSIFGR